MNTTEQNTPKRGRPFAAAGARRDIRIPVKVNESENAALEAAAARAGKKLAVWIREQVLQAATVAAGRAPKRR